MTAIIIGNFTETRNVTIKFAKAIPENLYDSYVASEIYHISQGVAVWMDGAMQDGKGLYVETSEKKELMKLLRASQVRILDYWEAIADAPVSERGFLDYVLYITSHEVHHRARLAKHLEGQEVDVPFMPRCYPKLT